MTWPLLLFACTADYGAAGDPRPVAPAAVGTRSAALAQRAGEVARLADLLAAHTRELEGMFDQLRAATPVEREAIRLRIQARADALREEALVLRDEVVAIEAAAEVY